MPLLERDKQLAILAAMQDEAAEAATRLGIDTQDGQSPDPE